MRFWFVCMVKAFRRWLTMKLLAGAVALLLCSTAVADGPLWSHWYCDFLGLGHTLEWQDQQIAAGLPIEPSVRDMPPPEASQNVTRLNNVDAPFIAKLNGKHVAYRLNNITYDMDLRMQRVAVTEDNWRTSHNCVRRTATGTLDTTPVMSPFAGTAAWTENGRRWATCPYVVRLQQILHSPAGVIIRENNEGPRFKYASLYTRVGVRYRNHNNILVWADHTTPVASYTSAMADPPGTTPGIVYRVENSAGQPSATGNLYAYYWKSDADLDALDLRAKEWVSPRRGSLPLDSAADYAALERAQYQALYAAFETNSAPGWQGKIRTVGYGGFDENRQNDTASPPYYLGFYRDPDLTKPGAYSVNRWDAGSAELANEAANPKAWREYSICVGNPSAPIYSGYVSGRHAVVDPASFAGLMAHLAWRMQSPGKQVRLVEWDNAAVKPTHLIFAQSTNGTTLKPDAVAALTSIGRPDMLSLTLGDYEGAVLRSLGRIHTDPRINEYWRRGTTRLMTSPLNTATATKVYATETTIPGVTAKLVYVYTPCDLAGLIQVEGLLLPAERAAYYVDGSAIEIE
jgi:hypothetical protein